MTLRAVIKLLLLAWTLLLLLLIFLAGFVYSNISYLSLPIPKTLALATIFLPIFAGFSLPSAYRLVGLSSARHSISLPLIGLLGLQLIFEIIIATLALTHVVPASALDCELHRRWQDLFKAKNGDAIRAIQNKLNCCGYNSVRDMAWPFSTHSQSPCAETYGRYQSCAILWRQSEQNYGKFLFLITATVFVSKVLSAIFILTKFSWSRLTPIDDDRAMPENLAAVERLIEDGTSTETYRDLPTTGPTALIGANDAVGQGPRVEPSQLLESGHEWRDEREAHLT